MKDLLTKISATPIPLDLSLFCKDDVKDLKLPEGLPIEVVVKSNPIHLKKDLKTIVNNSAKIEEKVNELMEKKEYKISVCLTTYKYPLTYERGKDDFFYREKFRKRIIKFLKILIKK